jgi:branched-chain amino acid transport system substrate-binding protein
MTALHRRHYDRPRFGERRCLAAYVVEERTMNVRSGRVEARLVCAVAVAAALIAGTACGSSSDSGSTSTAKAAPKPSGAPIKIAIISDTTKPTGLGVPEVAAAARARVDAINAAGGIKGRPVELIACDSKQDPNAGRACARRAVAGGALAVVGMQTAAEAAIIAVLEEAKVPALGAVPTTAAVGDSQMAFCFNPGVPGLFFALVPALQADGAKKVAMLYPSNLGAASAGLKTAFDQGVEKTGLVSGGAVGYAYGDTQFNAPVAKATASGVDGLVAFAPGATQGPLIQTVRQQAPQIKMATPSVNLTPDVIKALGSAADGVAAVGLTQPSTATALPGIKQFNADMDAHADEKLARTDLAINAWAAVWTFERVAAKLPSISRAGVVKAMNELDGLDMGGIFPPLATGDRSSKPKGLGCAISTNLVFSKVQDGKLVALEPGKFYDAFGT